MLRRTKIVATLGPATDSIESLEAIIKAGVDVVRLNFSHGESKDHIQRANRVREVANKLGRFVAVLADLQGPKIRVGRFEKDQITLLEGQGFDLYADKTQTGDSQGVGVSYAGLYKDVCVSDVILLDDGRLSLVVKKISDTTIHTEVERGGVLSNNKGINIPAADLSLAAVTPKDIEDIAVGAALDRLGAGAVSCTLACGAFWAVSRTSGAGRSVGFG